MNNEREELKEFLLNKKDRVLKELSFLEEEDLIFLEKSFSFQIEEELSLFDFLLSDNEDNHLEPQEVLSYIIGTFSFLSAEIIFHFEDNKIKNIIGG